MRHGTVDTSSNKPIYYLSFLFLEKQIKSVQKKSQKSDGGISTFTQIHDQKTRRENQEDRRPWPRLSENEDLTPDLSLREVSEDQQLCQSQWFSLHPEE
jgi:hypothetical protein